MGDDTQSRKDEVYNRMQEQLKHLRKLEADQEAAPPDERPKYERYIKTLSEDVKRLDAELRRLAER